MGSRYIVKRGNKYDILRKGTGKVLSKHATKAKAQASFRAMMASKYGKRK